MLIDTHAHLNFQAFEEDLEATLKRAQKDGIEKIINVGADLASSQKAVEIAQKYENCFASVGIHPHHADPTSPRLRGASRNMEKSMETLEKMARQPKVVAIGECGLDYHPYEKGGIADPKKQKELFEAQIKLAQKLDLPLIIHNRDAHEDILKIFSFQFSRRRRAADKAFGDARQSGYRAPATIFNSIPGVFHCFSGDQKFLQEILEMGFYVGFDGNITYKNAHDLRERANETPIERLLLETDCPYLTPEPLRGLRNEPKNVKIIGRAVAEIKALPFKKIEKQTTKNAQSLFRL